MRWLLRPWAFQAEHPSLIEGKLAAVWTCSDLPGDPDQLFGLPSGSLVTVQVGGLSLTNSVRAQLCHGLVRYRLPLLVVLGHEECRLCEPLRAYVAARRCQARGLPAPPQGAGIGWSLAQDTIAQLEAEPILEVPELPARPLLVPASISRDGGILYPPEMPAA